MPTSKLHEALVQLFRDRPEMAAQLVREQLGVALPVHSEAHVTESGTPDANALTYQADLVLALREGGRTVCAMVVEVQLRVDPRKKRTWPHYVTAFGAELECPVILVVVTPDAKVQEWAAESIVLGPGRNVVTPFVLGPRIIPRVDEAFGRDHPELAVLSAIAHAEEAGGLDAAWVALRAVGHLDEDVAEHYTDYVMSALSKAARAQMRQRMRAMENVEIINYVQQWKDEARAAGLEEGRQEGRQKGRQEGRQEGRREGRREASRSMLARLIHLRFGALGPETEAQITAGSPEELAGWLERFATAQTLVDIFGD